MPYFGSDTWDDTFIQIDLTKEIYNVAIKKLPGEPSGFNPTVDINHYSGYIGISPNDWLNGGPKNINQLKGSYINDYTETEYTYEIMGTDDQDFYDMNTYVFQGMNGATTGDTKVEIIVTFILKKDEV
jgi:hypothetical protein